MSNAFVTVFVNLLHMKYDTNAILIFNILKIGLEWPINRIYMLDDDG